MAASLVSRHCRRRPQRSTGRRVAVPVLGRADIPANPEARLTSAGQPNIALPSLKSPGLPGRRRKRMSDIPASARTLSIEEFVGTAMDSARLSRVHYWAFALIAAGLFFDVSNFIVF